MSALGVIKEADACGVRVSLNGDSLVLKASAKPSAALLAGLFGAALVVLAIVLLAIEWLVTMAHAKQPNNFGLPPDIAAKVKAECAKVFPFYDTQITCIEDDAKAYHRLQKNDFGLPPEIAEEVKVRCAEIFPFYDTQITCIEDDARAYKNCMERINKMKRLRSIAINLTMGQNRPAPKVDALKSAGCVVSPPNPALLCYLLT